MNGIDLELLAQGPADFGWVLWLIPIVVAVVILLIVAQFFSLWLQAYASRANVTLADLIGMRLRKVDTRTIVIGKIMLVKAGIQEITIKDLESHYLAGGDVPNVVRGMIDALSADVDLSWEEACAIDLAGDDILEVIDASVPPEVIEDSDPAQAGGQL